MPQDVDRERPRAQQDVREGGAPHEASLSHRDACTRTRGTPGLKEANAVPREFADPQVCLVASDCPSPPAFPPPDDDSPADIFAVGFEEMVELSAGNIVNAR